MTKKPPDAPNTPGAEPSPLTDRIQEVAAREGLTAWIEEMARTKGLPRITTRAAFLAFLGNAPSLNVVLKDSLESITGVVALDRVTDDGFVICESDERTRSLRFSGIALYRLASGALASG